MQKYITVAERLTDIIKSPLFLWGNIFVSIASFFLLADFPVIILTLIGLWRLYGTRKLDFATEKIKGAVQWICTSMTVNFAAMAVQIVFWGFDAMPSGDHASTMPFIMPFLLKAWPVLLMFAAGFVACVVCAGDLREDYKKYIALEKILGVLLLMFTIYLVCMFFVLMPLAQTAYVMVILLSFGTSLVITSILYGILLIRK